jgi:hypothetical protein
MNSSIFTLAIQNENLLFPVIQGVHLWDYPTPARMPNQLSSLVQ